MKVTSENWMGSDEDTLMQIAIRQVMDVLPEADEAAVLVAARKYRREMGFAPHMDTLVARIETAVGGDPERRLSSAEARDAAAARKAETRRAYARCEGLGARLETSRVDARDEELAALDELIRINQGRLRMLKAHL